MKLSPRTIAYLIAATVVLLVVFSSCMTPKKAVDVLSRPKNEPVLAELCSTRFPISDSLIKGDTIVNYDTLWGIEYRTDTLKSEPQVITETKTIQVPKIVTKWVRVTDTIVRENTARVAVLGSQIANLNEANRILSEKNAEISQERDGYKSERNKWKFRFSLLLFGVGLAYAAKVKFTKKLW